MKRLFSRNLSALFVALVMILGLTTPISWAASCTVKKQVSFPFPLPLSGTNCEIIFNTPAGIICTAAAAVGQGEYQWCWKFKFLHDF